DDEYAEFGYKKFTIEGIEFHQNMAGLWWSIYINDNQIINAGMQGSSIDLDEAERFIWVPKQGSEPASFTIVVANEKASKFKERSGQSSTGARWRIIPESEYNAEQAATAAELQAEKTPPPSNMADRFGARRTTWQVRDPIFYGEMPQNELSPLVQRAITILPHLKDTLQRITRARFVSPSSHRGAASLHPLKDIPAEYELCPDKNYQDLEPEATALVVFMQLP